MKQWIKSSKCDTNTCMEVSFTKSSYSASSNCVEVGYTKSSYSSDLNCVEVGYTKSSYSGNQGSCVETHTHGDQVHVRDSKDADGPYLTFGAESWASFVDGVKAGEFAL